MGNSLNKDTTCVNTLNVNGSGYSNNALIEYIYTCCFSSKGFSDFYNLYLTTNSIGTASGDVSSINVMFGDKLSNATACYTCYVDGVNKGSDYTLTFC